MKAFDYWVECVNLGAESCGLSLTADQAESIAASVEAGHDNYGMAFYSPPSSERINSIGREWQEKYNRLKDEFDAYREDAETAVKTALRQHSSDSVGIGKGGSVYRFDGRTTQIQ